MAVGKRGPDFNQSRGMKTVRALLKKDLLRFWPLLALWVLMLAAWAWPNCMELSGEGSLDRISAWMLTAVPLLFAALLVMADGPARRRLDVHLRPIPRWAFVLAKGLGMLLMIVLPMVLAHAAVFTANDVDGSLAVQALGEMVLILMARCLLAGCMAALCAGIMGWVEGAVVLMAACALGIGSVQIGLAAEPYLAGAVVLMGIPLVSAPDLRHVFLLAGMALIFVIWPRICWRAGWTSGWGRWAGVVAIAGVLFGVFGKMESGIGPLLGRQAKMGTAEVGPPHDPRGNEERAWIAADQALAEKTVREAMLRPVARHWQNSHSKQWMHTVAVGQERSSLPSGVFVDWRCGKEPPRSGSLSSEAWSRSGFIGTEPDNGFDYGPAGAAESLLGLKFDGRNGGRAVPEITGWSELGTFSRTEAKAAEGDVNFEIRLTGRVWRVEVVREIPLLETRRWQDSTGCWEVTNNLTVADYKIKRRLLVLAWPSTADQGANGLSCWLFVEKNRAAGTLSRRGVYPFRYSSGWWANIEMMPYRGNDAVDDRSLVILKLEYLGEAERGWSTGPLRFEDVKENFGRFNWPERGNLPLADFLTDLEKTRPDSAVCSGRDVQRYLWNACRGVAFAGVQGENVESVARPLAPLAGKFRETFRQGLSGIDCMQNRVLQAALRQGLPEAEYKAMNLPPR